VGRLRSKRILLRQPEKITAVAKHNVRFEWQLSQQRSAKFFSGYGFSNDEGTRSANIKDVKVAQSPSEDTWAKRPMPTNVDTSKKNDKSHSHRRESQLRALQ
jgi:hypothetical protein